MNGATLARGARIAWTIAAILIVQTLVCAAALAPVVLAWVPVLRLTAGSAWRVAFIAVATIPSYFAFALLLMLVSPVASRITGARTPDGADLRLSDLDWPLLRWVRYLAGIHLVRVLSGTFFRGSPFWTAYLRLSGARLGRRVYVNTLAMSDYNLIECGDDVVIGDGVHLSGHTVEAGVLRTGRVRIGSNVTIGLGSAIEIDVEIASGCQIGALSFVPKHTRLTTPGVYAGIPVKLLKST